MEEAGSSEFSQSEGTEWEESDRDSVLLCKEVELEPEEAAFGSLLGSV